MKCSICKNIETETLLNLKCGNLDGSVLYDPVVVACCNNCGHVFNKLNQEDKFNMLKYYEAEHSPNNLCSPNIEGDMPGSSNENSLSRYSLLYNFIVEDIKPEHTILDIGCATGGFLRYLKSKGYNDLHGVDFSHPYIEIASRDKELDIQHGTAELVPYEDHCFDFLLADQVVEHLLDPNLIFIEAKRILKNKGLFCISVPNAVFYKETLHFDFYWFLMREHIQHFNLHHLSLLAQNHGFRVLKSAPTFSRMTSAVTTLPNLSILFELSDGISTQKNSYELKYKIKEYIKESYKYLNIKRELIHKLKESGLPFFIFGVARELGYLYENTELPECNILGFVDDTHYKQTHFTFAGRKIENRSILKEAQEAIMITAVAHNTQIQKSLRTEFGFKGAIIEL